MVPVCLYSKVKAVLSLPGGGGGTSTAQWTGQEGSASDYSTVSFYRCNY